MSTNPPQSSHFSANANIPMDTLAPHICVLDETGEILAVNQAWKNFADANPPIPPGYGIGINYLQLCEQADGPASEGASTFAAGLRAVLFGECTGFTHEYPCHNPNGEKRWFNARVVRDTSKNLIVVSHENITPYKQAEELLQESEAMYRHLFAHHPFPTWIYDLETLAFLEVNEAAVARYGYSRAEFLEMTIKDIRPAEELPRLMKNLAQPRQPLEYSEGWRHQLKGGRVIEVSITSHALLFNGRPAVLVTAQDITLHKQQLFLQSTALEASANAIMILNRNGSIEWANPAFTTLTGYRFPEEVFAKNPRDLLRSGRQDEAFYKTLWDTILAGQTWRGELVNRRKDGSFYDEEMTITPVHDPAGQISHFIAVKQDITERKRTEEAIRQTNARLASVVAVEHALAAALTQEDIYTHLVEGISQFFPDVASIFISRFDAETQMIQAVKGMHDGEWVDVSTLPQLPLAPPGKGTQSQVIRSQEPLIIEKGLEAKLNPSATVRVGDPTRDTQSALYVPMLAQQQVVGLIHLQSYTPYRFTEEDAHLLSLIANTAAVTLQNARLFEAAHRELGERKQAEAALRQSEALLSEAQRIGRIGHWKWTAPDPYLIGSDQLFQLYEMLPPSNHQISRKLITTFLRPEELKRLQTLDAEAFARQGHLDYEFQIHFLDGKTRWLHQQAQVTYEHGEPVGLLGILQDITERKEAENALRQSEEHYRHTLDHMLEGCQIIDHEWRYRYINEAAAQQGRMHRETLLGKTMMEMYPGIEQTPLFATLRDCMENRVARPLENIFAFPDGSSGCFNLSIQPVPEGLFILSEDITERKKAEDQVQRQLQWMSGLHAIDRAISSSLDMNLTLEILITEIRTQLNFDAVCVLMLNPYSPQLEYRAGKGFRTPQIRQTRMHLGEGLAGKIGLERKSLYVPSLQTPPTALVRHKLVAEESFVTYLGLPLIAKGTLKGVLEIFHRTPLATDPDWMNYLETISEQAAIAIDNAQLFEGIQHSNLELTTAYDATIVGWSHAMDLRDKETEGHTQRVTELTLKLALQMNFPPQELLHIRRGALLHDIGKIGVPDQILLKPGKLTDEEWAIMRQHPTYALEMLSPIAYLRPALDIPYCHHEKWDGTGYPRGLKGEQIPLAARLFAIIDVWDALRSDRPYRKSWSAEKTRDYLVEQTGLHFDPQVVEAFLTLLENDPMLNESWK
ncbi:MAG TPA: PAS domain S-box protein [Anaerolineales bacterium]|nr:PAS domain S-box protein [Anaerolineales bacterium]